MKKLLCVFVALMSIYIAHGQQPAFLGISVGTSADEFINRLEQQGFAVRASEKKINEERMYYLYSGNFEGTYMTYPAIVRFDASVLTRTVTKVHVEFYFNDEAPKDAQVANIIKLFEQKYGVTEYYNKSKKTAQPTIENANMARWYMQNKPAIVMTFIGGKCQFDFGFEDNTLIHDEAEQLKKNQVEGHKQLIKSSVSPDEY